MYLCYLLILSADPQSRLVVINVFAHVVRPYVSKSNKQNKFQAKTMFTISETVGLSDWIIGDTCLVSFLSFKSNFQKPLCKKYFLRAALLFNLCDFDPQKYMENGYHHP